MKSKKDSIHCEIKEIIWAVNFIHFHIEELTELILELTIGSYISVCSSRYEACRKFWVHKRCVRVARGVADVWTDCFITFSSQWKIFFLRDLLADVMSMHNRNMKHACTIEFDWTNLLAYNFTLSLSWLQEGLGTTPLGKWKCYRYMWDLKSMYIHNRNEWSVKKRCLIVPSSLTQSILKNYFCIYVTMCYMPTFKARGDFYITRDNLKISSTCRYQFSVNLQHETWSVLLVVP